MLNMATWSWFSKKTLIETSQKRGTLRLQTPTERPSSVAGSTGPPGVSHQKTVKNGHTKEYDPHGSAPQGAGLTWMT